MSDQDPVEENVDRFASEWVIASTGMTEAQARWAAKMIEKKFSDVGADPMDPRAFMPFFLDRWSAEAVKAGLELVVAAGGEVGVLLDEIRDFLDSAYPYDEGEQAWPGLRG